MLGLRATDFLCVGVVGMDDRAADSYRLSSPDHTDEAALIRLGTAEGDARLLKPHQVLLRLRAPTSAAGELDVLVASSLCQGFSHMRAQAFGDR